MLCVSLIGAMVAWAILYNTHPTLPHFSTRRKKNISDSLLNTYLEVIMESSKPSLEAKFRLPNGALGTAGLIDGRDGLARESSHI